MEFWILPRTRETMHGGMYYCRKQGEWECRHMALRGNLAEFRLDLAGGGLSLTFYLMGAVADEAFAAFPDVPTGVLADTSEHEKARHVVFQKCLASLPSHDLVGLVQAIATKRYASGVSHGRRDLVDKFKDLFDID